MHFTMKLLRKLLKCQAVRFFYKSQVDHFWLIRRVHLMKSLCKFHEICSSKFYFHGLKRSSKFISIFPSVISAGCCFSKKKEDSLEHSVDYINYQMNNSNSTLINTDDSPICLLTEDNISNKEHPPVNCPEQNSYREHSPENCTGPNNSHFDKNIGSKTKILSKDDEQSKFQKCSEFNKIKVLQKETVFKRKRKAKGCSEEHGTSNPQKTPRLKPNYFVAVRVSNPKIHETLKDVQECLLKEDARLKPALTSLSTLHITLMVMHIEDSETHNRALNALKNVYDEHEALMIEDPMQLEFKGLGSFNNKVLFAKLSTNSAHDRLLNLRQSVIKHFENESIFTTEKRFEPHLTIAKLRYGSKHFREIKKINQSHYALYKDAFFGMQIINGIQLLSMDMPMDKNGYYQGIELLFVKRNSKESHGD